MKIDKNVPMPDGYGMHKNGAVLSTIKLMAIGDSIFFEGCTTTRVKGRVQYAARMTGFKLESRKVDGGVRLWRTA